MKIRFLVRCNSFFKHNRSLFLFLTLWIVLTGCPKSDNQLQLLTDGYWRLTSKIELKDSLNFRNIIRDCEKDDRIQYFTSGKVEHVLGNEICDTFEKTNQKLLYNWKFGETNKNTLIETKILNNVTKTSIKEIESLTFKSLVLLTHFKTDSSQITVREHYSH